VASTSTRPVRHLARAVAHRFPRIAEPAFEFNPDAPQKNGLK